MGTLPHLGVMVTHFTVIGGRWGSHGACAEVNSRFPLVLTVSGDRRWSR